MNEQDLMKSITDIDEEYIEDAAKAAENGAQKKKRSYRLWAGAVAAAFALCIGIGSIAGGSLRMGSSGSSGYTTATTGKGMSGVTMNGFAEYDYDMAAEEEGFASSSVMPAEAASIDLASNKQLQEQRSETKLVKRAHLTVQTTEFDETKEQLEALVERLGGYIEYSDLSNGNYYSNNYYKSGYFTVRVPADKYSEFLGGVTENCHVASINESVEDIGQQYFDTETRLATLKTKLERLQQLLAQAKDLSDIIALESAISDTEYQIDSYTSTLNRYDSLVGYATINVDIQQVSRVGEGVNQNPGFFAQLGRAIKNGILNFFDGLGDVVLWAAYNAIAIVIVAAAVIVIRKKHLIRRLIDSVKNKE